MKLGSSISGLRVVPGVVCRRRVVAAVAPLLASGPLEEGLVGEARHVDVDDPKVRQWEVLAPSVKAARRLVAHAQLEHVARGPAARREQWFVRGAVVVLGQPVRALVAAPLVEERWWDGGGCASSVRAQERVWVRTARTVEQRAMMWCASVRVAGGSGCALGEVFGGPRQRGLQNDEERHSIVVLRRGCEKGGPESVRGRREA